MYFLLRRGPKGKVHSAVREGGGSLIVMMTRCGLSVRWDQPHKPWERAQTTSGAQRSLVTCHRCQG
jgi:hypothetical protein